MDILEIVQRMKLSMLKTMEKKYYIMKNSLLDWKVQINEENSICNSQ